MLNTPSSNRFPTMDFQENDIVCPCSGTRLSRLRQRFLDGLTTLDALSDATGVCSGCAGCESDVAAIIEGFLIESAAGSTPEAPAKSPHLPNQPETNP